MRVISTPVLQRFTTVDPVQVLDVPLQWNPYLYGDNSPVTKADPSRTYESHPWTDSRFVVEYVCGRNTVDAGSGWDFTRTVWIHVPAGS